MKKALKSNEMSRRLLFLHKLWIANKAIFHCLYLNYFKIFQSIFIKQTQRISKCSNKILNNYLKGKFDFEVWMKVDQKDVFWNMYENTSTRCAVK